jgi:hypothetical protein
VTFDLTITEVLRRHGTRELWRYTAIQILANIFSEAAIYSRAELERQSIVYASGHFYGKPRPYRGRTPSVIPVPILGRGIESQPTDRLTCEPAARPPSAVVCGCQADPRPICYKDARPG